MQHVDLPQYGGCNVTTETTPTIVECLLLILHVLWGYMHVQLIN